MTPSTRTKLCTAALLLSLLASGCGGGGSGGDLTVDFGYGLGYAYLFRPADLELQGTGLQGNTPTCSVVAGTLPAGLSLQSNGCSISGTPTEVKVAFVTVRLTVSGHNGQVDRDVRIETVGPPLSYPLTPITVMGAPVSYKPASSAPTTWTPQPGETLVYLVSSGTLPAGLALNAATGEISGLLASIAVNSFVVTATVSGPLGTQVATSGPVSVRVGTGGLSFFYGPNDFPVVVPAGGNVSLTPLFNFGANLDRSLYTFSNYRLAPTSPPLPAGLSLDPVTGALTGVLQVPAGTYEAIFEVDLAADGKSGTFTSSPLVLTVS